MNGADEKALKKWTRLFDEADAVYKAATTDAERDKWYERRADAAKCIAGIGERANARRNTIDRHKSKKKVVEYDPENDPEPQHAADCGLNCARGCPWDAWRERNPKSQTAPVIPPKIEAPVVKIEAPKPAPVIVAPIAKPRPVPRVVPPVIREPREGFSGFFYKENFWLLPIDERNAKAQRIGRDAGLKSEWDTICEGMRAPREAPVQQKAVVIERPAIREHSEVFAMGQPRPISEARAPFHQPTMQNATGPVTRELDKRVGMPDMKPEEVTPSR